MKKILLSALVLIACVAVSIPLIQRLSVEWVELQTRRFLDDRLTLPEVARDFDVPLAVLTNRLGFSDIPPEQLSRMQLPALAARRGQSLKSFKRDLIAAVYDYQLGGTSFHGQWRRD